MIVIDTETTGIDNSRDELLQVSIVSETGECLFDSYIKPTHTERWDRAMAVNGITPLMVSDKPTIDEVRDDIQLIIDNSDGIIGYNTRFDTGFLNSIGISTNKPIVDVMRLLGKKSNNRYWKLTDIAEQLGFDYSDKTAHNSLVDCEATLYVFNVIRNV